MRAAAIALLVAGVAASGAPAFAADRSDAGDLSRRPLALPAVRSGERCPVMAGSREAVPREPFIFCSGCLWFGKGPVYFAWTFRVDDERDALFGLEGVPREGSAYRAKTSWVSSPDYSGPILIRGRRLDGTGWLRFRVTSEDAVRDATIRAPAGGDPSRWSFWPAHVVLPGPGCYGIQIDTLRGSDIVIFRASSGG